jgi:hypothetical protein
MVFWARPTSRIACCAAPYESCGAGCRPGDRAGAQQRLDPDRRQHAGRHHLSWPQALRRVRAWLAPWVWLQRCWRGWSASPSPPPLQQVLDWVGLDDPSTSTYYPNQQTTDNTACWNREGCRSGPRPVRGGVGIAAGRAEVRYQGPDLNKLPLGVAIPARLRRSAQHGRLPSSVPAGQRRRSMLDPCRTETHRSAA